MCDVSYSEEGLKNLYLLYGDDNTINIFVEDKDKEYEYETIFNRLFGDEQEIRKIFAVGGKTNLKDSFHEFGEKSSEGITNVYIADGDFDRIIYSDEMIDNPHFIYLESYNIENYLIDENAAILYLKGKIKKEDSVVKTKLQFDNWLHRIVQDSSDIFLCHCFIKKYFPDRPTISLPIFEHYLVHDTGMVKEDAVNKYYDEIQLLDNNAILEIDSIKKTYLSMYNDFFNLICGKYLLDSLICHVKNIIGGTLRNDDFRWFLTTHFDITKLNYVKSKIDSL